MREKIMSKASDLFMKLGFKSVTMDDIAGEMGISKKTIYKFFSNKEILIEEITALIHSEIHEIIGQIVAQNFNAIEENYQIRKMFKEMFQSADTSPVYQLKKHYPSIFEKVMVMEMNECNTLFKKNIEKGIAQGLYRKEIPVETFVKFYYNLIFSVKEQTVSEKEGQNLELQILEYHTRAIATLSGIAELEKQLKNIEKQ
jgi:AcrR family transcriptional regulator